MKILSTDMLNRFRKFVWEEQAVESSVGDISLRDLVTNSIDPLEHNPKV